MIALSGIAKFILRVKGKYEEASREVFVEELITVVFTLICCVPMFGYVYEKPFLNQTFWQVVTGLAIVHIFVAFWLPKQVLMRKETSIQNYVFLNLAGLSIGLPSYYMLISYSFISFPGAG